jgi:hypothetical protein
MGFDNVKGWVVFLAVPLVLWMIGGGVAYWKKRQSPLFAYIAGSDNRLSLSRLQAFLWTLVIFGAFAAAMTIHTRIEFGSVAEKNRALTAKEVADKAAVDTKAQALKAMADAQTAGVILEDAERRLRQTDASAGATEDEKNAARAAVATAMEAKAKADQGGDVARRAAAQAVENKKVADMDASRHDWVKIPAELLALAGIAIGSGVFSSFISTATGESKTACVTRITYEMKDDLKLDIADMGTPVHPYPLVIEGRNMGSSGRVRVNGAFVPVLYWRADGTQVIADVPPETKLQLLTVDTPNGKLSYMDNGMMPRGDGTLVTITQQDGTIVNLLPELGQAKITYEFIDLFRDDKNPNILDTMKFQMFGWTLVAILIYCYLLIDNLSPTMAELPTVPQSIVVLTGLSQGGYLASKAIGNANK